MRPMELVCLILLLQVLPTPFADITTDLPLPDGNDVWTLEVLSRGGLDGRGDGDIRISSDRTLECSQKKMACEKQVTRETVDQLSRMISSLSSSMWDNSAVGICY